MLGKQISAQELNALIQQGLGNSLIVDVRTPEEFARGTIAGAKNMPVDTIATHAEELKPYSAVYVFCLSGGRSQLAVAQLQAAGLTNVLNLTSGLLAWRAVKLPLTQ